MNHHGEASEPSLSTCLSLQKEGEGGGLILLSLPKEVRESAFLVFSTCLQKGDFENIALLELIFFSLLF